MKERILLLSGLAVSGVLNAATWYYTGAGYKNDAFTNTVYWSNGDVQCTGFSAEDDFVVRDWKYLWSQVGQMEADFHFAGKSLTLGEIGGDAGNLEIRVYQSHTHLTFDNEGLFLAKGHLTGLGGYRHRTSNVYGNITVLSPESAPFKIWSGTGDVTYTNRTLVLNGPFSAAAGTMAVVGECDVAGVGQITTNFTFKLAGSCTGYYGKLKATGSRHQDARSYATQVQLAVSEFPGTLIVGGNGILGFDSAVRDCSVGTLELEEGAILKIPASSSDSASITVTNSFAVNGRVQVELAVSDCTPTATGRDFVIVTFPADCDVDEDDFEIVDRSSALLSFSPACYRAVIKTVGTEKRLLVSVSPLVTLDTGDKNTFSKGYDSAFDKDGSWSDGKRPEEGKHYLVRNTVLRSPETETAQFKGDSLTIVSLRSNTPCTFMVFNDRLELPVTRLINARFASGSHVPYPVVKAERFEFSGDDNCLVVQIDGEMEMSGPWTGDGTVNVCGNIGNGSNGRLRITGDNSAFLGKIRVTVGEATPDPDTIYQTLLFSDEKALGGRLETMTFDALELNSYGMLEVTNSVSVTAANNRGIHINGFGRVNVPEGKELAVSTMLTVNGTLAKYGAGALTLGGELRFGPDGSAETPGAAGTSAVLQVTNGVLKVASVDALNGLAVQFTGDSALLLDPVSAVGELAAYGIRNTKAEVPFSSADGKVKLLVGGAAEPDGSIVERALFTVQSEDFDAADALLVPVRSGALRNGWKLECSHRTNEDGTVTKTVRIIRAGFVFNIR